jgi:hypothetical protein
MTVNNDVKAKGKSNETQQQQHLQLLQSADTIPTQNKSIITYVHEC